MAEEPKNSRLSFKDFHNTEYKPGEDELTNYRAYKRKRTNEGINERLKLGDPRRDSREASRRGKGVSPSKIPSYNTSQNYSSSSGTGSPFHRKHITISTDDSGDHEAQKRGIAIGIGGGQSRAQRAGKKDRVFKGEPEKDRMKTGDYSFGGGDSSAKPKINMKAKPKGKLPEGAVNEISKDLAGRYTKKRADDLPHAGYMMNDPHSSERRKKGVRDYVKMQKGIKTAVNKLTGKAMVPATEANMSDLSYDADIHSNGSMKVKKMGKDIHLHGKSYHSSDDHAKVAKKMGMKISSHGKTMGGTRSTLTKESVDEGYRSGHGSGSGTVHGGKHKDPAFQALMKKHGVTHKLVGPKNNKAAKLIGSPDNIRKVLQSEDKTTDAERAAIDAFMKKKGAKQLPPGKAQGHTGKSFSIKPMGISPDKMGLKGRGKHLDKDLVHKEDIETVKTLVGERPKGLGWGLHSSGQQTGKKHDVWKRTTKKVAAPKFNKEEKGRGPTGIAYSVKKGHPDAENPSTRKKYPERQTPEYKKKFFGKVEKESVEMKTFFQLRESMKCH